MRRLVTSGAVALAAGTLIMFLVGGGAAAPSARAASITNGLIAYVQSTSPGPLTTCTAAAPCTTANSVWDFIHIINANQLTNRVGGLNRDTWPNSFAVSSIDEQIFVNGIEQPQFDATLTPPPNASPRFWSGHWPSTVACPGDGTACNVVLNPAVLPGENTAIVYTGWVHGSGEPNGTYVFKYTIHGTLNGNAVDLTTSSPPIQMAG